MEVRFFLLWDMRGFHSLTISNSECDRLLLIFDIPGGWLQRHQLLVGKLGFWHGYGSTVCSLRIHEVLINLSLSVNFVFALPAFFTIDRFGRRPLLLVTFPCVSLLKPLVTITRGG